MFAHFGDGGLNALTRVQDATDDDVDVSALIVLRSGDISRPGFCRDSSLRLGEDWRLATAAQVTVTELMVDCRRLHQFTVGYHRHSAAQILLLRLLMTAQR